MNAWLPAALRQVRAGEPAVLVTVAQTEGSTPRDAGAKMLVSSRDQWDTLGGGHLEWRAQDVARTLLQGDAQHHACKVERVALGPSLGQCCGGAVTLVFELLGPEDELWLQELDTALRTRRACIRQRPLNDAAGRTVAGAVILNGQAQGVYPPSCGLVGIDGQLILVETFAPPALHLVLFGAGHVGQALVRILSTVPCTITWVDERDGQFPADLPAHVEIESTDTPEAVIAQAPAGSCFLVMTHCHALDQRLCQHIFLRDDFWYFGLIGSRTKRRKFERRLQARGVDPGRFSQMVCPVGIEGIDDKAPEIIAIAVAAQLLRVRAQRRVVAQAQPQSAAGLLIRRSEYADGMANTF